MYKRCICEISMCIIKFKQFKMVSLFQLHHVIRIYHLQHHDAFFFYLITAQCQCSVFLSGQMDAGLSP